MAGGINTIQLVQPATKSSTRDPMWVRWLLIVLAAGFLGTFVLMPICNVFVQAFGKGVMGYTQVFNPPERSPDEMKLPRGERMTLQKTRNNAPKIWNSIKLTLGIAAIAVPLNLVFGVSAAWLIAKHRFKGRSLLLSVIDLPFSISPVVSGLVFVLVFGRTGALEDFSNWSGWSWVSPGNWYIPVPTSLSWRGFGTHWWPVAAGEFWRGIIFTPVAMVLATIFVTFPFVCRSLIPLMESQGTDDELAALTLGANGWQMFRRVTLPNIKWGLLYGVILCNARAMGEFGAVSVVTANTDSSMTIPLRINDLWETSPIHSAFAVASLLTLLALVTLVIKTAMELWTREERVT